MFYVSVHIAPQRINSDSNSVFLVVDAETTFDYSIPGMDRKRAKDMSEDISDSGKIPKIIPSYLKQIRRLLSTIAVQKSIGNERKTFLMLYPS